MQLVEAKEQTDLGFTFLREKTPSNAFFVVHPTSVSLLKLPAEKGHHVN